MTSASAHSGNGGPFRGGRSGGRGGGGGGGRRKIASRAWRLLLRTACVRWAAGPKPALLVHETHPEGPHVYEGVRSRGGLIRVKVVRRTYLCKVDVGAAEQRVLRCLVLVSQPSRGAWEYARHGGG